MNVQDHLRVLREQLWLIALAVLLGILGALSVFLITPPKYTANVSLYVSAQVGDNPQQAFQGAQLSEQRVKSYNELVTGDRVLTETIARLGLATTPEQLASRITASNALDSVIINIEVADTSPQVAALIANTIGNTTTQVVDELERPAAPNGIAPVAVRMVQPAKVPDRPSSTGLALTLVIGAAVGAVIGIAGAYLRNALDTSIKSISDLTTAASAPNIGVIANDSELNRRPLVVHKDPNNPRAEAYRQLRTNLQFIDVDNPRKVFIITSTLPGEGKTTSVANLALALASAGSRVLLIEADLRRPKLSELFGLDRSVGLTTVLAARASFGQAVQIWGGGLLDVLSSGPTPPNPSELLASNQMRRLVEEARQAYDVVLIDSPPLLPVADAAALAPATDGAVFLCRFRKTKKAQVESATSAIRAVSAELLGTVLTMVPDSGPMAYSKYNTYYSTEAPEMNRTSDPSSDNDAVSGSNAVGSRALRDAARADTQATTRISTRRPPGGSEGGRP